MTHLVIQAPALAQDAVEHLSRLAGARRAVELSPNAVRLTEADAAAPTRRAVADYCRQAGVDWAYVEPGARLSDWKVLAMDMDSTLINIECIDEIADMAGLKPQVAAITEAAMRGEIANFSESLTRRVALLAGLPLEALDRVYQERLQLNPGAERLLLAAHRTGIKTLLVSGGFTWFTGKLLQRLQLHEAHANTLEAQNGLLTGRVLGDILDAEGKARHLAEFSQRHGSRLSQAIAIGDGANDLKMLGLAGMSVAYHAKPVVREQTTHALDVCGLDGLLNWFEDTCG
ncbi:Phosphoserine phosphatase [Pigmentiphaga humi]|uniref:Phosphoserine phosphatase n=1 Tax=Pigmentiphaga humi TaxID=2478468 RepID=A0A3P4B319_9BURK|nr:phosphoserine phosphatase SerB [Pigmentiphaga humi]VCU70291.1 Phosphoserine phosphatase [Pigmentiphaga humi]